VILSCSFSLRLTATTARAQASGGVCPVCDAVYGSVVGAERDLVRLIRFAATDQRDELAQLLAASPELALDRLGRDEEFFLTQCQAQLYAGDSALHAAVFCYRPPLAQQLVGLGADVEARNRRGAAPLHAAVMGVPGAANWNPQRQREVIGYLIEAGADPNAAAAGGVTPLHRAVRNRCADAVRALLAAGADPHLANDRGSTAYSLARQPTGRGGSGTPEAKAEQHEIIRLLGAG
jgi:ankyrin repeat protein